MSLLLDIRGLEAGHGGAPVLRGIDLSVGVGERVAVIGPNGAGKSTLVRAVMGLGRTSAGSVVFAGEDMTRRPVEARARAGMGLVPEGRRVFAGLTVTENLEVASWAGAASRRAAIQRIFALFPTLAESARRRAWALSGGQQQMLSLGRALMTEPRLVIMDEPTLGLAPKAAGDLARAIARIADTGTGVLIVEQSAARVRALEPRIVGLEKGVLTARS